MAPDDNSGARPAGPVVLRIKLRYDDVDAMVQKFASNVGKSGLFLPTKSIQPIGTEVKFELRLANDVPVLVGMGRVKHVKPPDPDNPRASFGMAIELMRVSREGREVIIRMIERRRQLGLPDVAIPVPEDVETARRAEVETQPSRDASEVREAFLQMAKQQEPAPAASLLTSPRPGSGPIGVARDEISGRVAVPALAPEKSRTRRPAVQELIDKAAELSARIVVTTPEELDMQVDVQRVLTRARALAGGDLDVELATLREAAAAPIEINVEAASAELARQLGGKAIAKRDKSARWAPPPSVAELRKEIKSEVASTPASEPAPDFSTKTRAETEASPSATIAAVVDAEVKPAEPKTRADATPSVVPQESYVLRTSAEIQAAYEVGSAEYAAIDPQTEPPKAFGPANEIKTDPAPRDGLMIDDDADVSSFERALDAARIHTGVSAPAPERPGDHELDDDDDRPGADLLASGEYELDPAERTQIGNTPLAPNGHPEISEQLAAQLDQQLAEAEQEANREIADGMGYKQGEYENEQEISDLDVLAEADEDDEDLLAAHGEAEVSGGHEAPDHDESATPVYSPPESYAVPPVYAQEPAYHAPVAPEAYATEPSAPRDSAEDFASRLDLGDDEEAPPLPSDDIDRDAAREFDREPGVDAPEDYREPPVDYGYRRAKRSSSEPSSSYTFAEDYPQAGLTFRPHETGEDFDEPHSYTAEPPKPAPRPAPAPEPARGPDPRLLKHGRPTTSAPPSEDLEDALAALQHGQPTTAPSEDLEDALAALDAGGIDVEQQRRRMRRPTPSSQRPLPGLPIERPKTGPVPTVQRPASSPGFAHTVRRDKPPTGQQPAAPQPVAPRPAAPAGQPPRSKGPTGQVSTAKPPPIPAAARKPPTQQVPIMKAPVQPVQAAHTPSKRAASEDDGVLIDFDDDE